MPWYAAHAVMYFKATDGPQDRYTIWENVHLIEAADSSAAQRAAEARARLDEGDSDGTLTWEGRPARCVFAGIRKLISVAHEALNDQIGNGDEITYSEFEVADEAAVNKFAAGSEVVVKYIG